MEFNGSRHNNENDSLKDLITYSVCTVAHLPEVKLDKLIIAQLYHHSDYGELLNKTRFFSLSYGPHVPLIRSTLKKQLENKSMSLTESRTSADPVYSNPCLIIKSSEHYDKKLSCLCLNTLREVVEDCGDKPYEHILDYTTRTIPYLSTCYREPIDWTLIQPYRDLKYLLSLAQRVQIHRFVEEPEKAMHQRIIPAANGVRYPLMRWQRYILRYAGNFRMKFLLKNIWDLTFKLHFVHSTN